MTLPTPSALPGVTANPPHEVAAVTTDESDAPARRASHRRYTSILSRFGFPRTLRDER
jgi:hypothetical protein